MSSNVDRLKTSYAAFGRGDFEAAFEHLDDDCVFHNGSDLLPAGGDFHGRQEIVGRWLPELGATYENLRLNVEEIIGEGDEICLCGSLRATVAGTDVKSPFCHIWHYEDGRAVDARFMTNEAEALIAIQQRDGVAVAARDN